MVGRKNGTLGVRRVRGNKVEKKSGTKDEKVFGREEGRKEGSKEGWSKFIKTVHCVHRVYFVIMYCSILTTTVIVSPLSVKRCLDAFVQLRKANISFVISVRPSVRMIKM